MSESDTGSSTSSPTHLLTSPSSPITIRSILLGLTGVTLICGLTPYNDYALNNTFLIGNNLPIGVMMLLFAVVLINAPLSRWWPDRVLTSGEIAVAFTMTLVSCCLPSSGLLRYLAPNLVVPMRQAAQKPDFLRLLETMNLPRWIWPTFESASPRDWSHDPLVEGFTGRWDGTGAPPYRAWLVPAFTWGIFIFATFGAMMCLCAIVRRQWFENERLPFPLAQIELALIEAPPRGKFLNSILSQRSFWLAFAAVFMLHLWRGLARVLPKYFVDIPVGYDLDQVLTSPPWTYCDRLLKVAVIYFTVVGVTYFVSSHVAFSLFFFYILLNVWRMINGTFWGDHETYGVNDETFCGAIAFAIIVLWIARRHWAMVIRQALRGHKPGEPQEPYLPYPIAFWLMIACLIVMTVWLTLAGCSVSGAIALVVLLMTAWLVIARIIAETGLVHGALRISLVRPWQMLVTAGFAKPVAVESFYLGSILQATFYDYREVITVYATHGMKVLDQTTRPTNPTPGQGVPAPARIYRRAFALMFLALFVGYIVSFASTLWTEYRYAWTQDVSHTIPINGWGADQNVGLQVVDSTINYDRGQYHPQHSPVLHFTIGGVLTTALAFLRLRFAWWPLHPIGFLIVGTFPSQHLWFSIFLGWLLKLLIVRFGGARFYTACKPFFIGLIVGEGFAAGFWLVVGIAMNALNVPYSPVNIMPG
ncbi:hypothetical protein BH09PLA1_BH09PLA1_36270 [soil metagenome]